MSLFAVDLLWNDAQIKSFAAGLPLPVFMNSARSATDREAIGCGFHVWTGIDTRYSAMARLQEEGEAASRTIEERRSVPFHRRPLTWPMTCDGAVSDIAPPMRLGVP